MKLLFSSQERYIMRKFPELKESKLLRMELEEMKLYREMETHLKKCLSTGHL